MLRKGWVHGGAVKDKRLNRSRRGPPKSLPWSSVASKDHAGPLVKAMLTRMSQPTLQSMGSSLKFCLVAEGKADIYLRDLPTMKWDTAAARCLVEVAGGIVCAWTASGSVMASRA